MEYQLVGMGHGTLPRSTWRAVLCPIPKTGEQRQPAHQPGGRGCLCPAPRASWLILLTIGGFLIYIYIYAYIIYLFICLVGFLAVLGAHCCAGFALAALSRGSSPLVLCRLLIAVASLVAERRL